MWDTVGRWGDREKRSFPITLIGIADAPSIPGVLEIRLLAALMAVADEGTFGAAALRLGYTQSSLSQQIRSLERAVGGSLFDRPRGPRRPDLTPLGRLVLDHARGALARDVEACAAIERFQAGEWRVQVATFQTVTNVLLPTVVRRLRAEYPLCDLRLIEDETEDTGALDADVVFFDGPGPADVDRVQVFADEHVVLSARGMLPLGPVRLTDLHDRPLIALPPICDQRRVEEALASAGVAPRVVFRTADNSGVSAMVRAGLGVAIMPLLAPPRPGVTLHPLLPALEPRRVFALTRGTLSPVAARLVELAVAAGAELERAGRTRL